MATALRLALEDLLRSRRLQAEGPPLRGEDRRLTPLATGAPELDRLLAGGFPRGQVSEVHGPASSGRTGLVLAAVARATQRSALVAWVDPADRLDPASAAAAGVTLPRLLWLRGGRLPDAAAAVGTLLGSGLFDLLVLDLAGVAAGPLRGLPGATWTRLQRMTEATPAALVLVALAHVAHGPAGVSLGLTPTGPSWSGAAGPGRLLRGLAAEARAGRPVPRRASLALAAV
jgi:hypothetical protein